MSKPASYAELAEQVGVPICFGCSAYSKDAHDKGLIADKIHWTDRTVNRFGIRNFLMLASGLINRDELGPKWQQVYYRNVGAIALARGLGFRFPRSYADSDRAWLAWFISTHKSTQFPSDARRWAGR